MGTVSNRVFYNKSKEIYEPAVCEAINNNLNTSQVVAYLPPAIMLKFSDGKEYDAIDYACHTDIMVHSFSARNCFGIGHFSVDVKTITPANDVGQASNFSIALNELDGQVSPDYFAFVYGNECHIVRKDIVSSFAVRKTSIKRGTTFYLFPLNTAKKYATFTCIVNV